MKEKYISKNRTGPHLACKDLFENTYFVHQIIESIIQNPFKVLQNYETLEI